MEGVETGKYKENYLETKKKLRRPFTRTNLKVEGKLCGGKLCGGMIKNVTCLRLNRIVKINQNNIGEQRIRHDDGALPNSDEDKKIA